jgi:hypothetical protein
VTASVCTWDRNTIELNQDSESRYEITPLDHISPDRFFFGLQPTDERALSDSLLHLDASCQSNSNFHNTDCGRFINDFVG